MFTIPKNLNQINSLTSENINLQDGLFGQTIVHIYVQTQNPLLENLLVKNPDLNIKNNEGRTPIYYAKTSQTVEKLINYGASLTVTDLNGKTPAEYNKLVYPVVNNFKNVIHRKTKF